MQLLVFFWGGVHGFSLQCLKAFREKSVRLAPKLWVGVYIIRWWWQLLDITRTSERLQRATCTYTPTVRADLTARGALPRAGHLLNAIFVCSPRARVPGVSRERKKGAKVEDLYETISTIGKGSGEKSSSILGPGVFNQLRRVRGQEIGPRGRGDFGWGCADTLYRHYT